MPFPATHASVQRTEKGTPYLTEPGVVLIAMPQTDIAGLKGFLTGFDEAFEFPKYLDDPTALPPGEALCKVAGQLCYMSFGPKRTMNDQATKYFGNIKSSGHGSVLEHANYSVLCYGISRSVTHELVRHRAGMAFSQVSQRYVSGKVLRFVERPEYQHVPDLHTRFLSRIDQAAADYEAIANQLLALQQGGDSMLTAEAKTDLRKKVQQCARSVLPNEAEAPIVVTGNIRAWRHVIEMRANAHAEIEIRQLAYRVFELLRQVAPLLFEDYLPVVLPDGTSAVETQYRKV